MVTDHPRRRLLFARRIPLKARISISLRLTMWFGGIFFAGSALFGISMWLNLRQTLTNERHQTLARRLDRLEELLEKDAAASSADKSQDFNDFAHATGNGLAEVFRADGAREFPSPSTAAAAFPWPRPESLDPNAFQSVQNAGQPYWVLTRSYATGGESLVLMVAAPDAGNLVVMSNFLRGLLSAVPAVLLIASCGGYWISRRALLPVDRIAATARSIGIRNISERIPVSKTGDELQRLAETCNAMLDRLELSVNQMKRFTADASHELRGPLSFTRTVAEIALKNRDADMASRAALQEIVDEVAKAAIMLDEMLTLARADSGPATVPREEVCLVSLVREVCQTAQLIVEQHRVSLSVALDSQSAIILGDPPALKRLLWILLDNATKYSKPHGMIKVALYKVAGAVRIVVADDGIGISPADLPFVFDRFYRADPSRGLVEGNGLGLAIAKWIAETHGAELSAASEVECGSAFTITFPCSI